MRNQGFNSDGEVMSSVFVEHEAVDTEVGGPSLTRQEFAEEADINNLMARYERTGVISHQSPKTPRYVDWSEMPDLHSALQILADAETAFMSLPAKVRAEFENDVSQFVKYAEDPENLEQMRSWGLAKPAEPPPEPMRVEVVNPPLDPGGASAPSGGATSAKRE